MRQLMRRSYLCGVLAIVVAGCGSDTLLLPNAPSLVVTGRTERGSTIHVSVKRGADTTLTDASGITLAPADAGTVLANGDVQLTKAGALLISMTTAAASASLTVNVTLPPTIVFDGLTAGNRDIYRVSLDGGELTRLTTNPADDAHPTASGTNVVFNSFRDANSELYTIPIAGGTERRLTTTSANETQAALSPDGKRIAYANSVTGITKVWLGSIDFAAGTALTGAAALSGTTFGSSGTVEASPSWAPASDRLALLATATPTGGAGLFTAAATAGTTPTIVAGSGTQIVEVEPFWSFDGARIVYAAASGGVTEIYVRDVGSATATKLTTIGASTGQPAFLADGRIVFTVFGVGTASLRWLDPAAPAVLHTIPTPGLSAEHAAPIRP
jgi:dipeptidyl aminopeptidase/acylaminoacyl peptidase